MHHMSVVFTQAEDKFAYYMDGLISVLNSVKAINSNLDHLEKNTKYFITLIGKKLRILLG